MTCSMFFLTILLIVGPWYFKSPVEKLVTIQELDQDRGRFEASRPLKSVDLKERFAEHAARCRSYASTSIWENKSIVVQGFWVEPYEGLSIRAELSRASEGHLLIKPAPGFGNSRFSFPKIVPSFLLPKWVPVVHGDYVKIFGVYHAIGYDEPGSGLEYGGWLEFHKIERWNRQRERWEKVDYVY